MKMLSRGVLDYVGLRGAPRLGLKRSSRDLLVSLLHEDGIITNRSIAIQKQMQNTMPIIIENDAEMVQYLWNNEPEFDATSKGLRVLIFRVFKQMRVRVSIICGETMNN